MKRPFVYLVVSLIIGIYLASLLNIPIRYPAISSGAFILIALIFSRNRIIASLALYLATLSCGFILYLSADTLPPNHISTFTREEQKKVYLEGDIVDDPIISTTFYKTEKTTFLLDAHYIREDSHWYRTCGLVKVDLYRGDKPFGFGDEVVLEGLISRPGSLKDPGLFDYSKYLSMKDVYSVLRVKEGFFAEPLGVSSRDPIKKAAYAFKHKIRDLLNRYLKNPYSGFLEAILIGDRADLKKSLEDDFIKTGTVHVISISGLHVGLIAAIILAFFTLLRLPKKINLVVTLIALIFYAILAGANPPIVRSVLMFAIFAIGYIARREADVLNSLSLAAFLILLWSPKELFDPSFQLSFISIASTILITPKIEAVFGLDIKDRITKISRTKLYLLRSVAVSLAAWIGSWPLVALYFNIISPIAIVANLIIIPALTLLTAVSCVFLFIGGIFQFIAPHIATVIYLIEKSLFYINRLLSQAPFAYFRIPAPSLAITALYYGLISIIFLPDKFRFAGREIRRKHIFITVILFFNIAIWSDVAHFKKGALDITFLDVGQGDSALIELPGNINILVDAGTGGDEEKFDIGKNVVAPYLWNKGIAKLDLVVATHLHEDHLGGLLYILENFKIGAVIDSGVSDSNNKLYNRYKRILKDKRIRRLVVRDGDELKIGGASIYVLNPERSVGIVDSNDNSVVFKLICENTSAIFCGDITSNAMGRLISYRQFLKSDILKVPHHGGGVGDRSVVRNFLTEVSPEVSIVSARKTNDSVMSLVEQLSSKVYVTGSSGAVLMSGKNGHFKIRGAGEEKKN